MLETVRWIGQITGCLLLLVCCQSNRQSGEQAGGPCKYHTSIRPAKLARLVERNSNTFDAIFVIRNGINSDSISYNFIENRLITQQEINTDSLRIDSLYQYRIYELTSGSCNPVIRRLVLERYLPNQ